MTPIDYYYYQIQQKIIQNDAEQLKVLHHLQALYFNLLTEREVRSKFYNVFRRPKIFKGLYIWGGVGVGKTFLMDCFYQCLPFREKKRVHFHQFMHEIHQQLKEHQGQKNPLQIIAKKIAKETMIICFDEFFVSDIADAMILGRLFKALISEGICFVLTSNMRPDDLYQKGLQRELFLPTIALLKEMNQIIYAPSELDYRIRQLKSLGVFLSTKNVDADQHLEKYFEFFSQGQLQGKNTIEIGGRTVPVIKYAKNVIWFDFNFICSIPRNQYDYLSLAESFSTVLISNIPKIESHQKNTIALFIKMIDIFYDKKIRLICSSSEEIESIYTQGYLLFEFNRTKSRLLEMQSQIYWDQCFAA